MLRFWFLIEFEVFTRFSIFVEYTSLKIAAMNKVNVKHLMYCIIP